MSLNNSLFIPKHQDRVLIEAFKAVSDIYGKQAFHCRASGGTTIGALPDQTAENNIQEIWEWILRQNQMLIVEISMVIAGGNFHIIFSRGGRGEVKSAVYDEISFGYNQQGGEPSDLKRLEIVSYFSQALKSFDPGRTDVKSESVEITTTAALHESMLSRLEQLNEDVLRKTNEVRTELENDYAKKRLEIDEELRALKNSLSKEHDEMLAALKRKEDSLEQQKKAIDDRGNTHVRRELRNNMLSDVKSRIQQFGVSRATQNKRLPIAAVLIFTIGLLGYIIYFNLQEIHNLLSPAVTSDAVTSKITSANDKLLYILLARLSFATIAFTATAVYFVRWQNRWAEQHSLAEFQLQQFYIDVNRANWVIESGLEWRKITKGEMPDAILSSVTKNLFKAADDLPQPLHPADELASALLGSASKLKIKSGENEMEFNNPGKIGKEVEKKKEKEIEK